MQRQIPESLATSPRNEYPAHPLEETCPKGNTDPDVIAVSTADDGALGVLRTVSLYLQSFGNWWKTDTKFGTVTVLEK